jgi:hypothetical protein
MVHAMRRNLCPLAIACAAAILAWAPDARAYRLPPVTMTPAEAAVPAEETLARVAARDASIRSAVPPSVLADGGRNRHVRLSRAAREALASYEEVKDRLAFWTAVVDLKHDLAALHGAAPPAEVVSEADGMAKMIIQTIYDLSQEYRVAVSALVQNMLINFKMKKKGFCYHYVDDLRKALAGRAWRSFDLHWGEAWPKTFLENNALIITARGAPFASGIAVDAWRTAGKPFWTPVTGDRFPWQEAFNVEIENP